MVGGVTGIWHKESVRFVENDMKESELNSDIHEQSPDCRNHDQNCCGLCLLHHEWNGYSGIILKPLRPVSRSRCTVCLAEYHAEDTLRILPFCGHFFHATCIDIWLQQHSTCPVCRISLRKLPENKRLMQPMFSSAVRSQYVMDALDGNSDHCFSTGHGLSSRGHENRRMEPIQEDQFPSEGDQAEAGECNSILHEDSQKDTGSKQVESPSDT
ncbi:hypothetical protein RJ639_012568 [Escallonia herrerae]|uniref:RING-type domain-containing protein n=1 Tax=Escallonia herrerae TaxID=1293975 RepID=A0AA89AQY6_9ASTE|nr:hypothetical protein RJ639_012568 [Escallonia herrerae]